MSTPFARPLYFGMKIASQLEVKQKPNFRHWPIGKILKAMSLIKPAFAQAIGLWPGADYAAWALWIAKRWQERRGTDESDEAIANAIYNSFYEDGTPFVIFDLLPIAMAQGVFVLSLWRTKPTTRTHGITPWNLYFPWAWYEKEIAGRATRNLGKTRSVAASTLVYLFASAFAGRPSPHLAAYLVLRTRPFARATRMICTSPYMDALPQAYPLALALLFLLSAEKDENATIVRDFLIGLSSYVLERVAEGATPGVVRREVEEMGFTAPLLKAWARRAMKKECPGAIPLDCAAEKIKSDERLTEIAKAGRAIWNAYHIIAKPDELWHRLNGMGEFGRCVRAVFSPHPLTTWLPTLLTLVEQEEEIGGVPAHVFEDVANFYSNFVFKDALDVARGEKTLKEYGRCRLIATSPKRLSGFGVSLTAVLSKYYNFEDVKRSGLALWTPYEEPCIPILLGSRR